jgi:hypothetical protein
MDFAIRVLLANYFIYETPRVTVIHEGFRTWEQGRDLLCRYMYGIGAMLVKHLKYGHWSVLEVLFHFAWRWAFKGPMINLGNRRHSRLLRLSAFTKGFLAGALTPVDKTTGHCIYQKRDHGMPSEHGYRFSKNL